MRFTLLRRTVLASAAIGIAGCATAPSQPDLGTQLKQAFVSEDPCSNNARNIGIVGGAVMGALLGNAMGGKNDSRVIGAAMGGVVGGLIGADMDRKRCELSKVAKKYDLDITFANIESQGEVKPVMTEAKTEQPTAPSHSGTETVIGNTVTVRDKDGEAGHFKSGSDQLTSRAQEYFAAIAAQYAPETVLATETNPKRKEETRKQLAQRHILLVGHTDDTGASQLNASLSERRARAVAAFLKQKGVPEASIYYQGAGETLPISDNRTDAGRAANRRVEIIEVVNETGFKKYLEIRKPQYAFYRSQSPTAIAERAPNTAVVSTSPVASTTPSQITKIPPPNAAPIINFGGDPYSPNTAKIDTGSLLHEKGFSFVSKAQAADDDILVADCSYDRPRASGTVKSLHDGSSYKTSDHLPQLYGKTWASDVNGNLVIINHLAVLRGSGVPANLPELKVYAQYKPGTNKKPDVSEEPAVNSYLVDKGVLYRMFPRGDGGLKCMDLLFGTDGATTAKAGKLIYASGRNRYVADLKPQLQ